MVPEHAAHQVLRRNGILHSMTTYRAILLLVVLGTFQLTSGIKIHNSAGALSNQSFYLTDAYVSLLGLSSTNFKRDIERSSGRALTYYGGPVVKSIFVIPIYWNSGVLNQVNLNQFYSAITTGQYMTFLSQYSTNSPAQTIGNGLRGTPVVAAQTGTQVTDSQIQTFLSASFSSNTIPKPTSNNYYPVHFPPGVTITSGSDQSCVVFCAYHGTFVYNGVDVYYGVIPDLGSGGCQNGCGSGATLNNLYSVSSHEFAETVTDPAVGLATTYSSPLAWYNRKYGEIGDICNGQQTVVTLGDGKQYTVQKLWSNSNSACVSP